VGYHEIDTKKYTILINQSYLIKITGE